MTERVQPRFPLHPILPAVIGLVLSGQAASAATQVTLKNNWPAAAEIGFDGAAAIKLGPRDSVRVSLSEGEHSIQCRFEGSYDGCNMAERFTIEGARDVTLTLVPVLALPHALQLSKEGALAIETRADGAWATTTLDVPGAGADCADYSTGKLGSVSQSVRARVTVRDATLVSLNLCGQQHPAIGTRISGAQVFIPLRFVTFKERNDRSVVVRQ